MSVLHQVARAGGFLHHPFLCWCPQLLLQQIPTCTHQPSNSTPTPQHSRTTTTSLAAISSSSAQTAAQQHATTTTTQQHHHAFILPMPSLSHAMSSGRITKWLKSPGDAVSIYEIIAEVTTDNLVDEAYKVDDFAGSVTLLLESQEEAYLAAVLVPEGQDVRIGTPVAVLCEDEEQVPAVAAAAAQQLAGLDVYDEAAMQRQQQRQGGLKLQLLEWQSYLKESSKKEPSSDSSCGCM